MTTNRVDTTLPEHSWIPFYEELAHKLVDEGWRTKQPELVQMLKKMKGDGVPISPFVDGLSDYIDPFTVFALFNYQIGWKKRRKVINAFKFSFNIGSGLPKRKPIVPDLPGIGVGFFAWHDGIKGDIDTLWDVLKFVVGLNPFDESTDRGKLIHLINEGLGVKAVGISKLTMGLYWVNPYRFLHVDTVNAIGGNDLGIKATDGASYLQCLERTRELVQCPFPNLNIPIWVLDERQDAPKVWVVCADQSRLTGDFISKRYFIGWEPRKVDMSSVKTREEIVDIYDGLASQLENFLLKMEPGDYVITPSGKRDFFYCTVGKRGLFFSSNDRETRREAHWIGGPLPKDALSSIPWNNQRSVFEVGRTDQRNEFLKLIGRNDLIENA